LEDATALGQDRNGIRKQEEDDRHRDRGERGRRVGQLLGAAEMHIGRGSPLTRQPDHLLTVVQSGRSRARARGVAEQEASAAADLQQSVVRPQLERLEDRAAREVMGVVRAIHLACAPARRAPRDPVGQPVLELVAGPGAPLPSREIIIAEAELAQELRLTTVATAWHD
jgi:hypothetical protein